MSHKNGLNSPGSDFEVGKINEKYHLICFAELGDHFNSFVTYMDDLSLLIVVYVLVLDSQE